MSYQGSANGPTYGTFVTRLREHHDAEFGRNRRIACIQVRCADFTVPDYEDYEDYGQPMALNAMEDEVDIMEQPRLGPATYVDIHLLSQDTSLCEFRYANYF